MRLKKKGILLMSLSGVLFGFLPILVKWGNQHDLGAVQTCFCRFVIALLGIALLHYGGTQKIRIVNREALLWRGILGGLTVLLYFMTLQLTTAAKGTLLNYTYSIWANVFGVLFLRHKPPKGFALRNVSSVKHLCRPSIKATNNPDGTVGYQLSILPVKNIPKDSDGKDQVVVTTNDPETPEFKVDVQCSH